MDVIVSHNHVFLFSFSSWTENHDSANSEVSDNKVELRRLEFLMNVVSSANIIVIELGTLRGKSFIPEFNPFNGSGD